MRAPHAFLVVFLLLLLGYAEGFPSNAGGVDGAFLLSASSATGTTVQVSLYGVPFRGLVLAALDAQGNRVGSFSDFAAFFEPQTRCEGAPGSVLQHNDAELKNVPQVATWTSLGSNIAQNASITFEALVVVSTREWFKAVPAKMSYGIISTPTAPIATPTVTPPPQPEPAAASFVDFVKSPWFFLTIWGVFLVLSGLAVGTRVEESRVEKEGVKQAAQVLWTKQERAKKT